MICSVAVCKKPQIIFGLDVTCSYIFFGEENGGLTQPLKITHSPNFTNTFG